MFIVSRLFHKERKISLSPFLCGLLAGFILVSGIVGGVAILFKTRNFNNSEIAIIQPVSAAEIYPLFFCPCCGQPLDKNKICCGSAKERIDYIDSLVAQNFSEQEIILAYVKKYGLNSFIDADKGATIKAGLIKTAPADRPIISLSPSSYDLGDVSQSKGEISVYFEIKNNGKNDLIIDRLDTSCGCTSAAIVFQGVEGPRFAMAGHGIKSPTNWRIAIPAGEIAQLKVYYNPDVHQDFRGFATREIQVYSNDPIDFEKKIVVELNQVD